MSYEQDFALALALQNESFNHGESYPKKKRPPEEKSSLADPSWELIDPTPDIIGMFIAFDMKFFWGQLKSVVIRWSKRMYTCAGICSYTGRGGLCTISLSEPLLKLRPRKDTVETLLHEMIHAYLFVTHNNKDRSGHGPEFHKHMYRINAEAGVNITVYHTFHDEVNHYKTHWWRCDGPCRSRAPYFGTVKRSSNRAPGPNDFWWNEHKMTCGGNWVKVKEPDNVRKKQVVPDKNNIRGVGDIQKYFNNGNSGLKSNRGGTLVITKPPQTKTGTSQSSITDYVNKNKDQINKPIIKPFNSTSGNLVNVKGFKDFNTTVGTSTNFVSFTGSGNNLGTSGGSPSLNKTVPSGDVSQTVRNHWQNKFNNTVSSSTKNTPNDNKKTKRKSENNVQNIPTITIDDDDDDDHDVLFDNIIKVNCPICNKQVDEKQINAHLDTCIAPDEPINLDESMETEFTKDFISDSSFSDSDTKKCPLCNTLIKTNELSNHLESCVTIDFSDDIHTEPTQTGDSMRDMLRNLGYSEEEIKKSLKNSETNDVNNKPIQSIQDVDQDYWNMSVNTQVNNKFDDDSDDDESYLGDLIINDADIPEAFPCPSCSRNISLNEMNSHLDSCLG